MPSAGCAAEPATRTRCRCPSVRRLASSSLTHRLRPAASEPEGALALFHGRGTDEHDLFPLLDVFDPGRRLLGATPRGPLSLPPGGAHWYVVRRVGFPDPDTFRAGYRDAADWLDSVLEEHGVGHGRTVLGGFSQGGVMAYALGLGKGRPRPAGILALSCFLPTVDGWALDPGNARDLPVAMAHGTLDPVIPIEFAHRARQALEQAGARVSYRESPLPHTIDPHVAAELPAWVREATKDVSL